jgi:nitroimidazol reductase NimA-like FMN-containing flavoprotein (pyridoxamine 5'-phosphate oxidase superfamily)
MRRTKLEILDQEKITELLNAAEWGILGISHVEYPVLVPLNFVRLDATIYFHGALAGEKFELCKDNPSATFVVVDAYSQLPSYFFDPVSACPATQLYKSVVMRGSLRLANSHPEKARAMQALMEKLQPQGGYEPITEDSDLYRNKLKGVAVIAFDIEDITAKFKLGQDQTPAWRDNVSQRLLERGCPIDHHTIEQMERLSEP